jgi:glycerol-3-phosphate O-acyltransferase
MSERADLPGGIRQVTGDERFRAAVLELSETLGREPESVSSEAEAAVGEMAASHAAAPVWVWRSLGRRLTRNYRLRVDEAALRRLRALDDEHTLVWLPSHRSYLDTWIAPMAFDAAGFPPYYVFGGANLSFWPFGDVARRTGLIFIRRDSRDDPVYRMALRQYLAHLVRCRADFGWSIEGGRTRTGKLRPPRYGLLRYLSDAVRGDGDGGNDVLLVPVSIVYDQLPEVGAMVAEAHGGNKRSEDIRWLVDFVRRQSHAGGQAYVDFGEPVPLAERLNEFASEPGGGGHEVERVALDVCHRINRVTPVVPGAVVTIALLAADRGLTLDEVVKVVRPLASYLNKRGVPVACDGRLDDPTVVARALDELVAAEGAIRHDGGREPVWALGPDQHLVAAFYRNSALHFLVTRAVAELVRLAVDEAPGREPHDVGAQVALRLRDLLKFEFFFPRKRDFLEELKQEVDLLDDSPETRPLAPLVLRPFLESYLVVADCLCALPSGARLDDEAFLQMCLGVGKQWLLQRRLNSAESVSLELFGTGLRVARHRGLDVPGGAETTTARQEFADELRGTLRCVSALERQARDGSATAIAETIPSVLERDRRFKPE